MSLIKDIFSAGKKLLAEFAGGLPGIDEATSFSQMIKFVYFFIYFFEGFLIEI